MLFMVVTESGPHPRAAATVGVRCFFTMKGMKSMKKSPGGLDYKRGFPRCCLPTRTRSRVSSGFSSWAFDLGLFRPPIVARNRPRNRRPVSRRFGSSILRSTQLTANQPSFDCPLSSFQIAIGIGIEIAPRQGKMPSCVSRPPGIDFDSDPDSDLDCPTSSCVGPTSFAVQVDGRGISYAAPVLRGSLTSSSGSWTGLTYSTRSSRRNHSWRVACRREGRHSRIDPHSTVHTTHDSTLHDCAGAPGTRQHSAVATSLLLRTVAGCRRAAVIAPAGVG